MTYQSRNPDITTPRVTKINTHHPRKPSFNRRFVTIFLLIFSFLLPADILASSCCLMMGFSCDTPASGRECSLSKRGVENPRTTSCCDRQKNDNDASEEQQKKNNEENPGAPDASKYLFCIDCTCSFKPFSGLSDKLVHKEPTHRVDHISVIAEINRINPPFWMLKAKKNRAKPILPQIALYLKNQVFLN